MYSHLFKKGSGVSRKIDKKSISNYNLEKKNFNMPHLHDKTVITQNLSVTGIKKHRSKVDGLFRTNQITLPMKLVEQSSQLSEKHTKVVEIVVLRNGSKIIGSSPYL